MEGFRYAAPPHAGAGKGLETNVIIMLQLGNIRCACPFDRDPNSFPAKPQAHQLQHPKDSTLDASWEGAVYGDMSKIQSHRNSIASYGDALDISCTEVRNSIWRPGRGAAEREM